MDENIKEKVGTVKIADDAIMAIAGIAATDVKGVYSLEGGITRANVTQLDRKKLQKCMKLNMSDNCISIRLSIIVDGSETIPNVTALMQDKVKDALEMMTGMIVSSVDVEITGVHAS
jgi:uncharacterized alkaline shock family protein YloU